MDLDDRVIDREQPFRGVGIVTRVAEHPMAEVVIDVTFSDESRSTYFQYDDLELVE